MRCRRISASSASRMNADRVVFRARVILSTIFRSRSSIVIWIVFTAVDSNVENSIHCTPHPVAAYRLVPAGVLRESVVLGCASSCQLQRGAPWQVVEFARYLEPTTGLIM